MTERHVTQQEFSFPAEATLMSTTDVHSHIQYANAAFVAVSGFEPEALIGAPHQLVRHPDMPRQAFADLWATLRAGHAWTGLVKNRRRNGDHYWVRANVAPVARRGQVSGYISVRTRPTREEVAGAEAVYRRFREGQALGLAFYRGLVLRRGWRGGPDLLKRLALPARIRLAVWPLWPALLGLSWACGLRELEALLPMALGSGLALAALDAGLQHQLAAPLRRVARQAAAVAAGYFDADVRMERVDEIGMLLRSINQAGLNVRALVADVSEQVAGLQSMAGQVEAASGDLGARTEQTSARLAEAAAALTRLSGSVGHNAQTADQASQRASAMAASVSQVGGLVSEAETSMAQISRASERIGDIIGVIDDIAFQTNILALNAAVEAARAGAQGRGFAVVAAEVRGLAQRSQRAAREIKGLIGASADHVQTGSALVGRSRLAMDGLVEQVRQAAALIADISAASAEQARGVEGVAARIEALDRMTQQNAAMAEQSLAASRQMRSQSGWLARAVEVFRDG
ncbi:methyl-accepting chemotaxis protein [Roseateles cavernae]|uniref:methyl-accepting chemotaxis protein n=1 Tax=Roseateles cavernae TaxID=3153578 RepID=UPI0032E4AFE9